jgi:hypothetical protein
MDEPGARAHDQEGGTMNLDLSALFYVLVAVILVAKFYVGSCGCS